MVQRICSPVALPRCCRLQRAKLLRGVGSTVLGSATPRPWGVPGWGWGSPRALPGESCPGCLRLLGCCRGCGRFGGAGGQECRVPAWQRQGGQPWGTTLLPTLGYIFLKRSITLGAPCLFPFHKSELKNASRNGSEIQASAPKGTYLAKLWCPDGHGHNK